MLSFHQPSPAMFDLLDRAFLMARGHVVFTGEPTAADAFFQAAGIPCPGHTAIAEHMLTCVSDPGIRDTLLAYALEVRERVRSSLAEVFLVVSPIGFGLVSGCAFSF
jgi:hypothetical protein